MSKHFEPVGAENQKVSFPGSFHLVAMFVTGGGNVLLCWPRR